MAPARPSQDNLRRENDQESVPLNVVLAGKRPIDLHIGHRLRDLREQRLLSLETLAGNTDITAAQLAAHEAGERMPPQILYSLAQAMGVPLAAFFAVEAPECPSPKDELADFPPIETAELLRTLRRLDKAARQKALQVVRMVAGEVAR